MLTLVQNLSISRAVAAVDAASIEQDRARVRPNAVK
jgi:hypothetical protein